MVIAKGKEFTRGGSEICGIKKLYVEVVTESEFYENVESVIAEGDCQGKNTNGGNV
jgi:hypothetical protein